MLIEICLAAVQAFREAKTRGESRTELQRRFKAIGEALREAAYANIPFAQIAPPNVSKLSDKIVNAAVYVSHRAAGIPLPANTVQTVANVQDFPLMWEELHQEVHLVVNGPVPQTVKVIPQAPIAAKRH
ncbi:hypothetical protein ACFWJS_13765 [Streptomyces sp. NPDC127061]|uniref:hypothetical protein n=1 Tax=Streptomyces sp. NPDC127061 TaxID=3347122 RepID=UPI00364F750C